MDGNKPKVSVLIPVYNTEKYIEETICSITGQTLQDIEIIVVNDGSADGSGRIIERLAAQDGRIRYVVQPNKGVSEARNTALGLVRGEYVVCIDSDDLLEKDALEASYGKCVKDGLDFVFFDAESFGDDGGEVAPWFVYKRAGSFEDDVYNGEEMLDMQLDKRIYKCSVCMNCIRAAFIEDKGLRFWPGIIHEDELFAAIMYMEAKRVGRIERSFLRRRLRSGSIMTNRYSERNLDGYMTVAAQLKKYGEENPAHRETVKKLLAYILNPVAYNSWVLPLGRRVRFAGSLIGSYSGTVKYKNIAALIFKKPLDKIKGER